MSRPAAWYQLRFRTASPRVDGLRQADRGRRTVSTTLKGGAAGASPRCIWGSRRTRTLTTDAASVPRKRVCESTGGGASACNGHECRWRPPDRRRNGFRQRDQVAQPHCPRKVAVAGRRARDLRLSSNLGLGAFHKKLSVSAPGCRRRTPPRPVPPPRPAGDGDDPAAQPLQEPYDGRHGRIAMCYRSPRTVQPELRGVRWWRSRPALSQPPSAPASWRE